MDSQKGIDVSEQLARLQQDIMEIHGIAAAAVESASIPWIPEARVGEILQMSPKTLKRLRDRGTLPFRRVGNKVFYHRDDVNELINSNAA